MNNTPYIYLSIICFICFLTSCESKTSELREEVSELKSQIQAIQDTLKGQSKKNENKYNIEHTLNNPPLDFSGIYKIFKVKSKNTRLKFKEDFVCEIKHINTVDIYTKASVNTWYNEKVPKGQYGIKLLNYKGEGLDYKIEGFNSTSNLIPLSGKNSKETVKIVGSCENISHNSTDTLYIQLTFKDITTENSKKDITYKEIWIKN